MSGYPSQSYGGGVGHLANRAEASRLHGQEGSARPEDTAPDSQDEPLPEDPASNDLRDNSL